LEYPWLLIRELAIQIAEQFEALGSAIGLRCSVVSVVNAIMQVNVYANSFLAVSV
jgi:superfamily II DNA/RNA helicase